MPEKQKPLKEQLTVIKFEHLNPALQDMIGKPGSGSVIRSIFSDNSSTIRDERKTRALIEAMTLATLLDLLNVFPFSLSPQSKLETRVATGMMAFLLGGRAAIARGIQARHKKLVKAMKKFGILQTRFEGSYPRDWINPTTVAKTHPAFYVNRKGDLVFPKITRTEYARYVFQKRFLGKLGLNPWRWRAYIEPPTRPKKISEFVKAKLRQWLAPRPRPAFRLANAKPPTRRPARAKRQKRRR